MRPGDGALFLKIRRDRMRGLGAGVWALREWAAGEEGKHILAGKSAGF